VNGSVPLPEMALCGRRRILILTVITPISARCLCAMQFKANPATDGWREIAARTVLIVSTKYAVQIVVFGRKRHNVLLHCMKYGVPDYSISGLAHQNPANRPPHAAARTTAIMMTMTSPPAREILFIAHYPLPAHLRWPQPNRWRLQTLLAHFECMALTT
jgi:hypothetical protein